MSKRIALPLLLAVAFVLYTGILDGNPGVAADRWSDRPWHLFANAFPGLLLASLLLVLTRRALLSFGLAFFVQGVVLAVSAIKMKNLGSPLLPADFRMVGQLKNGGASLLGGYLPHQIAPYLIIAAGIAIVVLLARYETPLFARRTQGRRLVTAMALTGLIGTLLAGVPAWSHVYDHNRLGMEPWSAAANAGNNGVVTTIMQFRLQNAGKKVKPDPNAAMQFLGTTDAQLRAHMEQAAGNARQTPDIVIVQSESFFDPSIIRGYEHEDFAPNLHRLAKTSSAGSLHVPTFGGGTIRTEFEVLTGLSLRYFANMQFPYLQMHNAVVPGMVRALRSHGYETVAVHGNDAGFWNRTTAFKALGFDRFVSLPDFPKDARKDGEYMADSAMTDEIMSQLPDAGSPRLVFAISMEAHGPYDKTVNIDADERDAIPVPDGIDGNAKLQLQNYIYHMRHADAELGRLAELLARRERPTLLVFYGDHLPALVETYAKAGFSNGQSMLTQTVPWILVDAHNDGPAPAHEDLAAWMLPGFVLERAGVHDDAYFALTQVLAPQLASLTHAPDAPTAAEDAEMKTTDKAMGNLALLRFKNRLDPLLAQYVLPDAATLARQKGEEEERAAAGARQ
ncbi:phosphoglycerol transferase MdoB-like AlkP superfamily enzyme [Luteibacter rhizovicinus]|uniref:Phosphoglycerol transferase MdoB-like AlkP superfamily enzyme n=1 Tax=Luteibacter rhizovicinus TaxID=242606 RepID=A0A4R3YXH8_9GAMM|nr:LTA synthase family protein [Luteibacter rhizovicinus]TCV96023.1 phosphoglycerol transferase MdoB-like AlkP superfamily enzyme [Luteibacter rhizovicinus]